eukprot:4334011-Pleurochrysis_carterae.AAC.1
MTNTDVKKNSFLYHLFHSAIIFLYHGKKGGNKASQHGEAGKGWKREAEKKSERLHTEAVVAKRLSATKRRQGWTAGRQVKGKQVSDR